MATPVFYQTMSMVGVDPTVYYTATASVTPETPAPPFLPGTQAVGSDGSQFVFVQASTSISLTDFVAINSGTATANGFMANSLTTTNVQSSLLLGIGSTGLVLKQSVTFIPAAAFFWALTRGSYVPATTSNGLAANNPSVLLFTTGTAGVVASTIISTGPALQGIVCINSVTLSTGISASLVPPAGTLSSTGLTVGPVVAINNLRTAPAIFSSTNGSGAWGLNIGAF